MELAEPAAENGSTIHHIAEMRPTATAQRRTNLVKPTLVQVPAREQTVLVQVPATVHRRVHLAAIDREAVPARPIVRPAAPVQVAVPLLDHRLVRPAAAVQIRLAIARRRPHAPVLATGGAGMVVVAAETTRAPAVRAAVAAWAAADTAAAVVAAEAAVVEAAVVEAAVAEEEEDGAKTIR